MHKLNRTAWMLLLLLALPAAEAWAQASAAASRPTELGRLWARVARWKWQQAKPNKDVPNFDSTSVQKFLESVSRADADHDPAGIASLSISVLGRLDKKNYQNVNSDEFIRSLEAVLLKNAGAKADAPKQPAIAQLMSQLRRIAQPSATIATVLPADTVARPAAPAPRPTALDSLNDLKQAAEQENTRLRVENQHLGWYRWATAALGLLLLLALWRLWRFTGQHREHSSRKHSHSQSDQQPDELAALQQQHDTLNRRHDKLQQDYDDLLAQHDKLRQDREALRQKRKGVDRVATPATVGPTASSEPPKPTPAASNPSTRPHFAASPENRSLTHLYVESDAFRPLLIHLPADPAATEATFEFNPAADQYFFTHNGVDQLPGAFAYARPDWQRDPQTIRTLAPGTLLRDQSGWRVQELARIEIS